MIVLIAGLLVGSFLNVLIARFYVLETIVTTRSHCPSCKKQISWHDLIPILSFVLLTARCRYCKERISWQYPIIEALTACLALLIYWTFGLTGYAIGLFMVFSLLLVITVIDINHHLIPDEYALTAVLLAFLITFLPSSPQSLEHIAWGALVGGGFLAAIVLVSKERWMGMGDISLGLILGLLVGVSGSLVGLMFAFVVGAVVSLLLIATRAKSLKDAVPFGPFLIFGTLVSTFWGTGIVNWYLSIIGLS